MSSNGGLLGAAGTGGGGPTGVREVIGVCQGEEPGSVGEALVMLERG